MTADAPAQPTFSVVVPAFNAGSTVASAVQSVLGQTRSELEVIVVDDGSTDDTAERVRALHDPRLRILSQSNRGLPAARNAGIEASRGRYVALLDSDDLLLPRYLELCQQALERVPRPGFAYTDAYVFDPVTGRVRRRSAMARANPPTPPPEDPDDFLTALLQTNFVYVSTMVPRTVLERVGGFDESRTSVEDYELWLRILLAGYQAAWVPGCQALYRKHANQMSTNMVTMAANLAAVYHGLPAAQMPSDAHRDLLERRRRSADRELRWFAPVASRVPLGLIATLKRAGIGEDWYDAPPSDVAAAFPDLTAV